MNLHRENEALARALWEPEDAAQRMDFLPVMRTVALYRTVGPEVRHRGQRVGFDPIGLRPLLQDDRRQGADPILPKGRNVAALVSDRQTDRHEGRMTVKPAIAPPVRPALRER